MARRALNFTPEVRAKIIKNLALKRKFKKPVQQKFFQKQDMGAERKTFNATKTAALVDNAASTSIQIVGQMAQGTDNGQRVGSKIRVKSIKFAGMAGLSTTGLNTAPYNLANMETFRVCVYVDKQANGNTSVTPSNVYDNNSTSACVFSGRTQEYLDRFDVLYEEIFIIGNAGPNMFKWDKYIKCDIPCKYASPSAATPISNAIYAYVQCSIGVTVNAPLTYFNVRLVYTDE